MEFKFDEQAFRRLHSITIPISVLMAILVLVLHQQVGLNPLIFFGFFTSFLMYVGSKFKFLPDEIKERRAEMILINNGKLFYSNEFSGYKFERPLKDVSKVVQKNVLALQLLKCILSKTRSLNFIGSRNLTNCMTL